MNSNKSKLSFYENLDLLSQEIEVIQYTEQLNPIRWTELIYYSISTTVKMPLDVHVPGLMHSHSFGQRLENFNT